MLLSYRLAGPADPHHRCAAGCREILEGGDVLCRDCAEIIVRVADEEHASSCDCLDCGVWSTARETLNGTALMHARRVVA